MKDIIKLKVEFNGHLYDARTEAQFAKDKKISTYTQKAYRLRGQGNFKWIKTQNLILYIDNIGKKVDESQSVIELTEYKKLLKEAVALLVDSYNSRLDNNKLSEFLAKYTKIIK